MLRRLRSVRMRYDMVKGWSEVYAIGGGEKRTVCRGLWERMEMRPIEVVRAPDVHQEGLHFVSFSFLCPFNSSVTYQ